MMTPAEYPPLQRLIQALAESVARDYLRERAAASNDSGEARPNPVPLSDLDQVA